MKITIFTYHDISSAYSCLLYLKEALERNYQVDIYSFTPRKNINDKNHYTFFDCWYGKIRKARIFLSHIHVFFIMLKSGEAFIINDLDFFIPAFLIKKIKRKVKIIHYNTEIPGKDVFYFEYIKKFYDKHAEFPDIIIDCLEERASYRKSEYKIKKKIYVIENTIPEKIITSYLDGQIEERYFFKLNQIKTPIIAYSGGCNLTRELGEIIKQLSLIEEHFFFLAFCYGKKEEIDTVRNACLDFLPRESYEIYEAISRDRLLKVLNKCDIGIVYYDPHLSVNHLYAAPSKFYEYLAVGLNVISSNNEGINNIINDYNLGVCIKNKEEIGGALRELLRSKIRPKSEVMKVFSDNLSYEKKSQEALKEIYNVLSTIDITS